MSKKIFVAVGGLEPPTSLDCIPAYSTNWTIRHTIIILSCMLQYDCNHIQHSHPFSILQSCNCVSFDLSRTAKRLHIFVTRHNRSPLVRILAVCLGSHHDHARSSGRTFYRALPLVRLFIICGMLHFQNNISSFTSWWPSYGFPVSSLSTLI